jgi:hypothetical protein
MKLFDTHAHLLDAQFDHDRNEIIPALPEHGVAGFLEACTEASDIPKITALVMLYDHVFAARASSAFGRQRKRRNLLIVERALSSRNPCRRRDRAGLSLRIFRQGKYSARPLRHGYGHCRKEARQHPRPEAHVT